MEKKAKGWMALRGNWGRKKRSVTTQIREQKRWVPSVVSRGRHTTDLDYQGLREVHKSYGTPAWANVSKRDIPILDENDLAQFDRFYRRPARD